MYFILKNASFTNNIGKIDVESGTVTPPSGDSGGSSITDYIVDPWACWSDGRESATSGYYSVVDYPVSANTSYSIPYGRNWFCENSSHTYISGGAADGSSTAIITTPANAAYLTICFKPDDIASSDVTITVTTGSDDSSGGSSGSTSSNPDSGVTTTSYGGEVKTGVMISGSTGAESSTGNVNTIANIPVKASTSYKLYGCRNTALLNSNKEIISAITGNTLASNDYTLTTTADTAYLSTCYYWTGGEINLSVATFTLVEV